MTDRESEISQTRYAQQSDLKKNLSANPRVVSTPTAETNEALLSTGKLNVDLLIRNAKILLAAGDVLLAKTIFISLIEHGEMLAVAYSGLASCYELENKLDLAIKAYREAIIYEPTFGSLSALAEIYVKKEDFSNAIGTLLRANNLKTLSGKQSFEIYKTLGSCYMHLGQLNNAEAYYRKAYDLKNDSDCLHINIGSLAIKRGDFSTALLHFNEAIRINPLNASARIGCGLAQLGLGKKDSALTSFAEALTLDIHDSTAIYHLLRCSYELKSFDRARDLIERYIKHNAVNSNILYSYAGILFHLNLFRRCIEECEKLISFKPEHEGAQKLKNLALQKLE